MGWLCATVSEFNRVHECKICSIYENKALAHAHQCVTTRIGGVGVRAPVCVCVWVY